MRVKTGLTEGGIARGGYLDPLADQFDTLFLGSSANAGLNKHDPTSVVGALSRDFAPKGKHPGILAFPSNE